MINYAFIHIPKNCGHSIKKMLETEKISNIRYYGHSILFSRIPKEYKQILIIREPVDRFSSAFFYIKKYNMKNSKFNDPSQLIDGIINSDIDAPRFLKPQKHKHKVNGDCIATDWVFHQQTAWIDNPYKIIFHDKIQDGFKDLGFDFKIPHINKSKRIYFEYKKRHIDFLKQMYKKDFKFYEEQRGKI